MPHLAVNQLSGYLNLNLDAITTTLKIFLSFFAFALAFLKIPAILYIHTLYIHTYFMHAQAIHK